MKPLPKFDWKTGKPIEPGVYIIWDGHWQRRVKLDRWKRWRSLRAYPAVWPEPLKWRENDEAWG